MLSDNIKYLRKEKGLSQEDFANRLNVVRQTVSKWENGLSVPDAEMLVLPPPAENPQLPSRPGTVRKSGRNNGAKNTRTGRRTSGYRR